MLLCRDVLMVVVVTAVVPDAGETAIISSNDNYRSTFRIFFCALFEPLILVRSRTCIEIWLVYSDIT
jgi:hypothetical protein